MSKHKYCLDDAISKFFELKTIPVAFNSASTPEQQEKVKRLREENEFIYNTLCDYKEITQNLTLDECKALKAFRNRVRERRGA